MSKRFTISSTIETKRQRLTDRRVVELIDSLTDRWEDLYKSLIDRARKVRNLDVDMSKINIQRVLIENERIRFRAESIKVLTDLRLANELLNRVEYALINEFEKHGRNGNGPEPDATPEDRNRWMKQTNIWNNGKNLVSLLQNYSQACHDLCEDCKSRLFTLRDIATYLELETGA